MNKERIIIDTDIGDDIDDALALALAVRSPELELVGVTTVFKNTRARAKLARRLLKTLGCGDVPVVPGMRKQLLELPEDTLWRTVNIDEYPGQYSPDMDEEELPYPGDAIDFMKEALESSPEPLTLVPIGPLTNIAMLLLKHPDLKDRIKRIVLMGGAYFTNIAEYNIMCDPEAARIVFESGVDITGVGLDVTMKCQLKQEEVDRIAKGGTAASNFLSMLIERHRSYAGHLPYLHDPLAVAVTFDESLVKTEKRRIGVELRGEFTRGMTYNVSNTRWWERDEDNRTVRVCSEVDRDRFVSLFLERILK